MSASRNMMFLLDHARRLYDILGRRGLRNKLLVVTVIIHSGLFFKIIPLILNAQFHLLGPFLKDGFMPVSWRPSENDLCQYWTVCLAKHSSLGWLYTYPILHFTRISRVFSQNTTKYKTLTIHFSYFIQISCLRKNKPRNPFDVLCECWPWCEMVQNAEHKKWRMRK